MNTSSEKKAAKPTCQDRLRIGKAIRAIRQQQNIEAKTLAEMTGVDAGNLSRIEQGKYSIGLDMLAKIAHSLGYQVELTPLPDKEDETKTSKNRRRYHKIDLDLLKPNYNYDYEEFWVNHKLLERLGMDFEGVNADEIANVERSLTFGRAVIFGDDRCYFDYGGVAGMYALSMLAEDEYVSLENRQIIYSVCRFVCNLISDNFVKEVEKIDCDELEDYYYEAYMYFYELTVKWMYKNDFTKENQVFALKAAENAIITRLTMIPVENMFEEIFPRLKRQPQGLEYLIR